MLRKLILTAVLAVAALTTANADASPPAILPHHRFEVLVARDGAWQSHGVYHLQARAEVAAARLRLEGYRVEIRQF